VLHGAPDGRSLGACLGAAVLGVLLLGLLLLALAFEGAVCLVMVAPLATACALAGGFVGYLLQQGRRRNPGTFALVLALPVLMAAEARDPTAARVRAVRTSVVVDAPPERVWREVIAFAELPPPEELVFRAGIAHPVRAEIQGEGVGGVRRCVFSTGAFVEPITVWDAPRELAFDVVAQPPVLRELSPWGHIDAPHIEGFLVSHRGRFLLEPLPGGRTRLEGTTWYSHRIEPQAYWSLWSDPLIGAIHTRVLEHVRARAESAP
jgi:hypothetical protein